MRIWKKLIARIKSFFVYSNCDKQKKEGKDLLHNGNSWYNIDVKKTKLESKGVKVVADIFDFANFFIDLSIHSEEDPITNLRLNKLLYFAQGCSLARRGKALFPDKIEAWPYGPVIPTVYHSFKSYKDKPIKRVYKNYDATIFSQEEFEILVDVAREYGKYTSPELVRISHKHGSPWEKAFNNNHGNEIQQEEIMNYFKGDMLNTHQKTILEDSEIIRGRRDKDGYLILPKELDDGWI